jgi:hypothetical protein
LAENSECAKELIPSVFWGAFSSRPGIHNLFLYCCCVIIFLSELLDYLYVTDMNTLEVEGFKELRSHLLTCTLKFVNLLIKFQRELNLSCRIPSDPADTSALVMALVALVDHLATVKYGS